MRLAAMMDLMLEQMREQARRRFGLDARAGHDRHRRVEIVLAQHGARRDQPPIGILLRGFERNARRKRLFGLEKAVRLAIGFVMVQRALECVDVIPVDGDDMIERRLERRKEARARSFEIGVRELAARGEQPMVRPRIVVRHRGEVMRERRAHFTYP